MFQLVPRVPHIQVSLFHVHVENSVSSQQLSECLDVSVKTSYAGEHLVLTTSGQTLQHEPQTKHTQAHFCLQLLRGLETL